MTFVSFWERNAHKLKQARIKAIEHKKRKTEDFFLHNNRTSLPAQPLVKTTQEKEATEWLRDTVTAVRFKIRSAFSWEIQISNTFQDGKNLDIKNASTDQEALFCVKSITPSLFGLSACCCQYPSADRVIFSRRPKSRALHSSGAYRET